MQDALYIAATGMYAQQRYIDTVANNLANVNTQGYKRTTTSFADLVTRGTSEEASSSSTSMWVNPSTYRNYSQPMGVRVVQSTHNFEIGELRKTDDFLDIALDGPGLIEVQSEDGAKAFVRGGRLKINQDGMLTTQSGLILKPGLRLPDDLVSLVIENNGSVLAQSSHQSQPVEIGQLELVRFVSEQDLVAIGDGVYVNNGVSEPLPARAGKDGIGKLKQGYIEGSNVKLIDEMVRLMVAQRSYEASVKVIQAADEMLSMTNNLRK